MLYPSKNVEFLMWLLMVILPLPLIQEGQLSVSGKRMCTILVNRLEDSACLVNVWLGKLTALYMTPLGWLGRKTSTKTKTLVLLLLSTKLTLTMPRKPASENVVCICRLLHLLANVSNILFAYRQTVWTQIRGAVWSGSSLFAKMTFKITSRWQSRW